MKLIIKIQLIELLVEFLLFPFIFIGLVACWNGTLHFDVVEGIQLSGALWILGLMYRLILLQLPMLIAVKGQIMKKKKITGLMSSFINLISLTFYFLLFQVFSIFTISFKDESILVPLAFTISVLAAPLISSIIFNDKSR